MQALIYSLIVIVFTGIHAFASLRIGNLFIKKKAEAIRRLAEARVCLGSIVARVCY